MNRFIQELEDAYTYIEEGTLLLVTEGEYSEYQPIGVVRALRNFSLREVHSIQEAEEQERIKKRKADFEKEPQLDFQGKPNTWYMKMETSVKYEPSPIISLMERHGFTEEVKFKELNY
tara:strand:- start:2463 stop:2816 length:354 start_codon:yes stop_codon:yes gene_type:complete